MRLLEGAIPEEKIWRSLVLFSPDQEPGLAWYFAQQLARASNGEAIGAVIVPTSTSENTLHNARQLLERLQASTAKHDVVHGLLIESSNFQQALVDLIEKGDVDLLLADGDSPQWQRLARVPCAATVLRGTAYRNFRDTAGQGQEAEDADEEMPIKRILVPTAGGPNTAQALAFLLPLAPDVEITALYVAPAYLGENEVAHGHARLGQLSKFVDAGEHMEQRVIQAGSVTQGIVEEASGGYDLVVIGATRENTIDRALFGDVVGAVVRESKTPVGVVWEPSTAIGNLARAFVWRFQNVIPRLSLSERTEVYVRIRRGARPNTDYYVLIGLSALIAALGLLLSSPAVVIGAMLVAPLMSPMIGAGLAIVLGNPRFLRLSTGAILKGVLLAIVLATITGFLQPNQPLTPEILSRTQPTLLDLGVALFAGLAGAYALSHSEAAAALPGVAISAALVPPLGAVGIALATGNVRESLGALLLFTTNLVTIIAAAVFIFVILGFRPSQAQKEQRAIQQRSVRVALMLLALITVFLGTTTLQLAREARLNARVNDLVEMHTNAIEGVEFAGLEVENVGSSQDPLQIHVTVRSTHAILHSQAEALRNQISADLQPHMNNDRPVAMTLTVIRVTVIDPETPPTATPAPEANSVSGPLPASATTSTP